MNPYRLGPHSVSTETIDTVKKIVGDLISDEAKSALWDFVLAKTQESYRRGVFEAMHQDDPRCQAEDQAGWPCCSNAAEFFVRDSKSATLPEVYCSKHRAFNRFNRADSMDPLYAEPEPDPEDDA